MLKPEAIREAEYNAQEYGGIWHVVKITDKDFFIHDEYYAVHDKWFSQHKGIKSEYKTREYYSIDIKKFIPKTKWYRKVIRRFNKFLLWLLKPLIDARITNRKT